jgi:hypothetical protein
MKFREENTAIGHRSSAISQPPPSNHSFPKQVFCNLNSIRRGAFP